MAAHHFPDTDLPGGSFVGSNLAAPTATYARTYACHVAWYSYTPARDGVLAVEVLGEPYWDTTLEVWEGAPAPAPAPGGTPLAFNDDSDAWNHSSVSGIAVAAGQEYLIGLGGYSCSAAAIGTATITVSLAPVPSAPLNVATVAGDAGATVTWDAPAEPYGLSTYRVLYRPLPDGEWLAQDVPGDTTTVTLSGLTNGQRYAVRVRARNAAGVSEVSERSVVTPMAVPTITLTTTPTTLTHRDDYQITVAVTGNGGPVRGDVHITVQNADRGWFALNAAGQRTINAAGRRVGTYTVRVEYSGRGAVLPGAQEFTIAVEKDPQTVDFALAGPFAYGGTVALTGAASSGLSPVTFASGSPEVCTVAGEELTFVGVGECSVTASQAGDATVAEASSTQTTQVLPAAQTISVDPLPALVFGQAPVTVTGAADSGLPVTFVGTGACSVDGSTLTVTGVGECSVTASQAGSALYLAADDVAVSTEVAKQQQVLTMAPLPLVVRGVVTVPVTVTSDLGLPVTLGASGACVVDGASVRTVATGTCEITAEQAGDPVTLPARTAARIVVEATPAVLEVRMQGAVGDAVNHVAAVVSGTGLKPGGDLSLTVHSTPTRLGASAVRVDGSAGVVAMLPEGLAAGVHRLVASGVELDGSAVEEVLAFGVAEDGTIAWIGTAPTLPRTGAEPQDAAALALLWVVAGAGLLVGRRILLRRRGVLTIAEHA